MPDENMGNVGNVYGHLNSIVLHQTSVFTRLQLR